MELVYAGAGCASRLLAHDLEIPSLNFGKYTFIFALKMMRDECFSAGVTSFKYIKQSRFITGQTFV